MAVLPTLDQFPSFADTHCWLARGSCQCIWWIQKESRHCLVRLQRDENQQALELVTRLLQEIRFTDPSLRTLAAIAERTCCGRHHRNKIWGSKLANSLAFRWQSELRDSQPAATPKTAPLIESEHIPRPVSHVVPPQMNPTPFHQTAAVRRERILPSGSGVDLPQVNSAPVHHALPIRTNRVPRTIYSVDSPQTNPIPVYQAPPARTRHTPRSGYEVGPPHVQPTLVRQAHSTVPTYQPSNVVAFAKHVVWERETLASNLLSPIEPSRFTSGSVYIFTYTGKAFQEMLKIGYTKARISDRLEDWANCGHGWPILLRAYYNVYHPERVELLSQFELEKQWYAMRWCNFHTRSHIEWFKVTLSTAHRIVHLWASWMTRANPYDRRGHLKPFWRGIVDFLVAHGIETTAELMMQVQEAEEGRYDLTRLLNSLEAEALRKTVRVSAGSATRSEARIVG